MNQGPIVLEFFSQLKYFITGSGAVHSQHHVLLPGGETLPKLRLPLRDWRLPAEPEELHQHTESQEISQRFLQVKDLGVSPIVNGPPPPTLPTSNSALPAIIINVIM